MPGSTPAAPPDPPLRVRTAVALVIGCVLVGWLLAGASLRTPAALDASAPAGSFSAGRAAETMERIYRGVGPHPVGSAANTEVRRRIVAELERLGLQPHARAERVCGRGACSWVTNIVAVVPGSEAPVDGPVVLLMCHYDSVPAGPGVGDDGSGVGIVIEAARALASGERTGADVVLLFSDGEEAGLYGARAFVDADPLASRVAVAVNVEARGTQGKSRLFETSGGSRWMLDAYLPHAERPAVSSLATTVYERMPNDTDLSVFARAGVAGLNFAFVGGGSRYHSRRDDLDHLSWSSVQHQGTEVLAAVRGLAASLAPHPMREQDTFETVVGRVVRWRRSWSLGLALGVTLVALGLVFGRHRSRPGAAIVAVVGTLAWVTLFIAGAVTGLLGLAAVWNAVAEVPLGFVADPWFARVAGWSMIAAVAAGSLWVAAPRLRPRDAMDGLSVAAGAFAVVVAALEPGASALPIVAATLCTTASAWVTAVRRPGLRWLGALGCAAVCVAISTEVAMSLEETFGVGQAAVWGGAAALGIAAVLPSSLWIAATPAGRAALGRFAIAAGVAAVSTAVGVGLVPAYDQDSAYPVGVVLLRDGIASASSWWAVGPHGRLPVAMVDAGFEPRVTAAEALPWPAHRGPDSDADPRPDAIELEPVAGRGADRRAVRLRSVRGSTVVLLEIHSQAPLPAISVEGERVELRSWRAGAAPSVGGGRLALHGVPREGVVLELDAGAALGPVRLRATDIRFGLPGGSAAGDLVARRPRWAAALQWGDVDLAVVETSW